jgi:hypothetical protein
VFDQTTRKNSFWKSNPTKLLKTLWAVPKSDKTIPNSDRYALCHCKQMAYQLKSSSSLITKGLTAWRSSTSVATAQVRHCFEHSAQTQSH